jgi:hypothetical protein
LVGQLGLAHKPLRGCVFDLSFALYEVPVKRIKHIPDLCFTVELVPNFVIDPHVVLKLVKNFSVLTVKCVNQVFESLSFFLQPIHSFLRILIKHLKVIALLLKMGLLAQ